MSKPEPNPQQAIELPTTPLGKSEFVIYLKDNGYFIHLNTLMPRIILVCDYSESEKDEFKRRKVLKVREMRQFLEEWVW